VRSVRWILPLALATAIAPPTSITEVHAQPSAPGTTSRDSVACMVARLDAPSRTLDVLTGVGHAFRMLRVRLPEGVEVMARGARAPIGTLTPGTIVLLRYRESPTGRVVGAVDVLGAPAPGRER